MKNPNLIQITAFFWSAAVSDHNKHRDNTTTNKSILKESRAANDKCFHYQLICGRKANPHI